MLLPPRQIGGPPKAEAAAFRALAVLPGVTVKHGTTDAVGAPAIGGSADGYDQLLLSGSGAASQVPKGWYGNGPLTYWSRNV